MPVRTEVRGGHRFASEDASSFARAEPEMQMVHGMRTAQLAWNVQILESEGRSGQEDGVRGWRPECG